MEDIAVSAAFRALASDSAASTDLFPLLRSQHRNRAGFNSTHIYGTRVPVEEPSTASIADIMSRSNH
jgi:hypothetical protein